MVCIEMEDGEDIEVELYEEVVGNLNYSTPHAGLFCSQEDVRGRSPSQDPIQNYDDNETLFAPTSRSALGSELATRQEEPRTVEVTMAPNVGLGWIDVGTLTEMDG